MIKQLSEKINKKNPQIKFYNKTHYDLIVLLNKLYTIIDFLIQNSNQGTDRDEKIQQLLAVIDESINETNNLIQEKEDSSEKNSFFPDGLLYGPVFELKKDTQQIVLLTDCSLPTCNHTQHTGVFFPNPTPIESLINYATTVINRFDQNETVDIRNKLKTANDLFTQIKIVLDDVKKKQGEIKNKILSIIISQALYEKLISDQVPDDEFKKELKELINSINKHLPDYARIDSIMKHDRNLVKTNKIEWNYTLSEPIENEPFTRQREYIFTVQNIIKLYNYLKDETEEFTNTDKFIQKLQTFGIPVNILRHFGIVLPERNQAAINLQNYLSRIHPQPYTYNEGGNYFAKAATSAASTAAKAAASVTFKSIFTINLFCVLYFCIYLLLHVLLMKDRIVKLLVVKKLAILFDIDTQPIYNLINGFHILMEESLDQTTKVSSLASVFNIDSQSINNIILEINSISYIKGGKKLFISYSRFSQKKHITYSI
jgi:hypothetical protein